MRTEKNPDGHRIRMILEGMATNDSVVGRVSSVWNGHSPFPSPVAGIIGKLCVDYYRERHKAPGPKVLKGLTVEWSEGKDPKSVQMVDSLLSTILEECSRDNKVNPEWLADQAEKLFLSVEIKRAMEKANALLESGKTSDAFDCLSSVRKVQMGKNAGSYFFQDRDEILSTFDDQAKSLIEYPDALGKFFGHDSLQRDSLLAFGGKEGSGKSWWNIDVAFMAMAQRKRVVFYEIGDLSRRQLNRRLLTRVAEIPWYPGRVSKPISMTSPSSVECEELYFEKGLNDQPKKAFEACRRLGLDVIRSKRPYFRHEVHPMNSINVNGIRDSLKRLEEDDYIPDVVIVDHADNLSPPLGSSKMDKRDQIDLTWKLLRTISQELHCLLVTATQLNRQSYSARRVKMEHISEDKRKLSHVNYMCGITVDDDDKKLGLCKLNWVKAREMEFNPERMIWVAGCLALGQPAVLSYW